MDSTPSARPIRRMSDVPDTIIIGAESIAQRVEELGRELTCDLAESLPTLIPVMDGAMIFASDLVRKINLPLRILPLKASSYRGNSVSTGIVTLPCGIPGDVRGKNLLLIDEILDTGRTLSTIRKELLGAGARSVRTCVLLRRKSPIPSHADYVGFEIPGDFVVGYGLDLGGLHRNLPDIRVLR